ncbi:hypothetical protein [Nitratireductor sp. GCM10026969]|uniref:hypothetical protein n=1 Tax=Nitratireductor sp. GCM10026969 TaxID=3252645 RepID=UPI0036085241
MKYILLILSLFAMAHAAGAGEIESAYTELDPKRDCEVIAANRDGGDWSNLVCSGYKGYPVVINYGDARESLFYGFPGDLQPQWESFTGFNHAGPTIEWRVEKGGGLEKPFATIHRWFVNEDEAKVEVLVVEKVAQPDVHEGCAVGYVVATGNAKANEKARRIADEEARDFICGSMRPTVRAGDVPLPALSQ